MYNIPTSVIINDEEFAIRNKGDYRMVLDCFSALSDLELSKREKIFTCLIIFYEDINDIPDIDNKFKNNLEEAVNQMYWFFNCGQPESPGAKVNYKLIDWDADSLLISSAINKVAGREIRTEEYLHWWTFMGYYLAIGESPLSHIVGIRNKILKGEKLEKHERKFRRENPQYFNWNARTLEQREADELVKQLWNNGK